MAFLDNSGDIILDAVLTDTGRFRLAKGDGTFKITKFAAADDEINYELYNKVHASGSAYFDLEILQTPVLEAFTNNSISMKSKLISLSKNNLLYLPMLVLNDVFDASVKQHSSGDYIIAVDETTEDALIGGDATQGILAGESVSGGGRIRVDQGLNTTEIAPGFTLDSTLVETQYLIEIDNRLGKLVSVAGTVATPSFVDDDSIATYSLGLDATYVYNNSDTSDSGVQVIDGPRGTYIEFQIQSSLELNTSTYLFTKIGVSNNTSRFSGKTVRYIDTHIRITGVNTGYSIDIPVSFVKCQSC